MVSLMQLWAPIILSAVLVFVCSSLVHMVLKWHNSDYWKLPNEEEVRAAIQRGNPKPGQYVVPHCADMKEMQGPEMQKKYLEGPIGLMYLKQPGPIKMGPQLGGWFIFNIIIAFFVAYVGSRSLPAGTAYLHVFQVVGATTFLAYAGGEVPQSIWMGKPWAATFKDVVDSLLYALVTGGAFGWLWPR